MADIFISYAREDKGKAQLLADALEQHGFTVFWDRRIPAGKRFDDYIGEQLHTARCVIVVWSPVSVHSPWVREEAAEGRERGILVPVRLEDITPPLGFRAIQAANLIDWQGELSHWGFKQLLDDVRLVIEVPVHVAVGDDVAEAEAQRKAEEERQRVEADAKRKAAEHRGEAIRIAEEQERKERDAAESGRPEPRAEPKRQAEEKEEQKYQREADTKTSTGKEQAKSRSSGKLWLAAAVAAVCLVGIASYYSREEPTNCALLTAETEKEACVRKAAEQGHAQAQFNLGWMYANGEGVEIDARTQHGSQYPGASGTSPAGRGSSEY